MKIPYVDLSYKKKKERKNLINIFEKILKKGQFVGGDEVDIFEKNF